MKKDHTKNHPTEKSALLETTTTTQSIPLNAFYTGHYADYNVPVKFQKLVLDIYTLHSTLNSEKYWVYFFCISLALFEYHKILLNNDLLPEIDLRIADNSTTIQQQLISITAAKRATSKKVEFISCTRDSSLSLTELKTQFVHAINGNKNSTVYRKPDFTAASHHLFPYALLTQWIDEIGKKPPAEPFYKIFNHTYFYMQKTVITAISLFAFAISASIQSIFHYVLIDLKDPHNDQEAAIHSIVQTALPIITFSAGLLLSIYAVARTKTFLIQRHNAQRKEITKLRTETSSPRIFTPEPSRSSNENEKNHDKTEFDKYDYTLV